MQPADTKASREATFFLYQSEGQLCQQPGVFHHWRNTSLHIVYVHKYTFCDFCTKKGNAKECSSYHTIALISHASKLMFKILQARLQQYVNYEFLDIQPGFRKGRRTRDQIANICWIIKKGREFQKKTPISALLTMPKALTVWITTNCGKFWKR